MLKLKLKTIYILIIMTAVVLLSALSIIAQEMDEGLSCAIDTFPKNGTTVSMNSYEDVQRVYVSTNNDMCVWAAISDAEWLSVSPDSGIGSAYIAITADSNFKKQSRRGTVTFSGSDGKTASAVIFTQNATAASSCNVYLSTERQPFVDFNGGPGTIYVRTDRADCSWTAHSSTYWITISSGFSGKGSGAVNYNVLVNNDTQARRGYINVSGKMVTINQDVRPTQQNRR